MSIDEINKSQYTIITIGVILISALLFTTFRLFYFIKSESLQILNKASAGTPVNASELQSLFTSMQKTIISTYFILSGFVLIIVIAGFIFLRDRVNSKNKIIENFRTDNNQKPLYDFNAFAETAVTSDENDIIISRFNKTHTVDSSLEMPPIKPDIKKSKPIIKMPKKKTIILISVVSAVGAIYILYNILAPGYYKSKATKMMETGKYSEAVSLYDKAIKADSKSSELYYGKGFSLSKLGNYKEAVECYSKAISLNSKYYEAYYNKGIALANMKESDNALYNLDMAIKLQPMKIQAYEAKGQLYEELQRYEEALECYKTIHELDPDYKGIAEKIESLSSGKPPSSTQPVVMYEPQTGTVLDSLVFRVIAKGKQQIALTGKIKAMNYAVSNFSGDVQIQSTDNMYSESLFITSKASESITISPDTYELTVKDRLLLTGHAQVFENKFEACLMDNAGNTIMRFGVNVQQDKEKEKGPFEIDIPIDRDKIKARSGYLALIQEVIDDGSKVGIIKIPVKFE